MRKMLDIGEALLISEPKIRFAVPIKVMHFPEYLRSRGPANYNLPTSSTLDAMDENMKKLREAGDSLIAS